MGKTRFTTLDVAAMVRDFRAELIGLRLGNIYDHGKKTYVLKLQKPDCKRHVILESGIRAHITNYVRSDGSGDKAPSIFALKMRKLLRTKRLEDVRQLGVDRVVDFQFGLDELECHLILEMYAGGNIVVTDRNYVVKTLMRSHRYSDEFVVQQNEPYPLRMIRPRAFPWRGQVADLLAARLQQAGPKYPSALEFSGSLCDYGPQLLRHALLTGGSLAPDSVLSPENAGASAPAVEAALELCTRLLDWTQPLPEAEVGAAKGFIFLKEGAVKVAEADPLNDNKGTGEADPLMLNIGNLDDVAPVAWAQWAHRERFEFASSWEAIDRFFSNLEAQRIEEKKRNQETAVMKKVDKARTEMEERVDRLEAEAEQFRRNAELLRENAEEVDAVLEILLSELAQGIRWTDLAHIVKSAQKNGDPHAQIIDKLRLAENTVVLLLTDRYVDGDEDDMERSLERVEVLLNLSAHNNAERYFDLMKKAKHKIAGTQTASSAAIKGAEKRAKKQLGEMKVRSTIQMLRKPFWFEKFHWFISSDNLVVVAGRDMQQNELLVKRFLRRGDVYVHADVHGAASVIVKNGSGAAQSPEIPPRTLSEAGQFCICRSSAWKGKHVVSAYWVTAEQVSKTAPTGEYLTTGSFMIRGKKNFLPPLQLELGFGIMFKLDDDSALRHAGERSAKGLDSSTTDVEDSSSAVVEEESAVVGEEGSVSEARDAEEEKEESSEGSGGSESEDEQDDEGFTMSRDLMSMYGVGVQSETPEEQPTAGRLTDSGLASHASGDDPDDEEGKEVEEDDPHKFYFDNAFAEEILGAKSGADRTAVKKRMSAAERRRAKKSGAGAAPEEGRPGSAVPQKAGGKKDAVALKPQPPAASTRGKRGKEKRMKKRYGNQDAEERAARMALLHGGALPGGHGGLEAHESSEAGSVVGEAAGLQLEGSDRAQIFGELAPATFEARVVRAAKDSAAEDASKAHLRRERRALQREDEEDLKLLLEQEQLKKDEIDQRTRETNLDSLTGVPRADDVLLFAVPVCGPYSMFSSYKYKVKLVPGAMKSGKAAHMCVEHFLRGKEVRPRERELVRAIPDDELNSRMIAGVRVTTAGVQAKKKKK